MSLHLLPTELFLRIASYLPTPSLYAFALTSRRMHNTLVHTLTVRLATDHQPLLFVARRNQAAPLSRALSLSPAIPIGHLRDVLGEAVWSQAIDVVRLLLAHGVPPRLGKRVLPPLLLAVHVRNKEIAEMLLEAGADVEAQERWLASATPVEEAERLGDEKMVELLVRFGAVRSGDKGVHRQGSGCRD